MSANNDQVGGSHYKAALQHWDLVWVLGLDYYVGQATKYVSRWRLKNGLQDLLKAEHFLRKYLELVANWRDHGTKDPALQHAFQGMLGNPVPPFFPTTPLDQVARVLDLFFEGQPHLSREDRDIIATLCTARGFRAVSHARDMLWLVIADEKKLQQKNSPQSSAEPGSGYVNQGGKEDETRL